MLARLERYLSDNVPAGRRYSLKSLATYYNYTIIEYISYYQSFDIIND